VFAVLPESNLRDKMWLEWLGFQAEAHLNNYRGLGETCLRMVIDRGATQSATKVDAGATNKKPPTPVGSAENISRDGLYAPIEPTRYDELYEPARLQRIGVAPASSGGPQTDWDPDNKYYIDFDIPFDMEREALVQEELLLALRLPSVRARMHEPAMRVRFINRTIKSLFSVILYGEQCGLMTAASLCVALKHPAAQVFAARQAHQEARHLTGFARYVRARWGAPAPCPTGLKTFFRELSWSPVNSRRLLGLQVVIEGTAIGLFATLHDSIQDPVAKRLLKLVLADELSHHSFGMDWLRRATQRASEAELATLEDWCARCVQVLMMNVASPIQDKDFYDSFNLDPTDVLREISEFVRGGGLRKGGYSISVCFRELVRELLEYKLITARSLDFYASLFDLEEVARQPRSTRADQIAREGRELLTALNAGITVQVR
jgi:hypothetical protein